MKRALQRLGETLVVLLILAAFWWLVWPTPWMYRAVRSDLVRIHRVTSRADVLRPHGWQRLEPNPLDSLARELEESIPLDSLHTR